jgi:hypothetical protein
MEQDPEYLKNQSRRGHERYRRRRVWIDTMTVLVVAVASFMLFLAISDKVAGFGWGYANYIWFYFCVIGAALANWFFQTLVEKVILAYVRHAYGPEPME